jgi:hypothetical protein
VQAARLPAEVALAYADDILRKKTWENYRFALQSWQQCAITCSMGGGEAPDPPEPPED